MKNHPLIDSYRTYNYCTYGWKPPQFLIKIINYRTVIIGDNIGVTTIGMNTYYVVHTCTYSTSALALLARGTRKYARRTRPAVALCLESCKAQQQ